MAIRHIREAFDQEAAGQAFCTEAYLRYEHDGEGVQRQIITIKGSKADGAIFNLSTPPHAMSDDPNEQARQIARMLKEEEPAVKAAGEPPAAGKVTGDGAAPAPQKI